MGQQDFPFSERLNMKKQTIIFLSGTGSNAEALLEYSKNPDCAFEVAALFTDRPSRCRALEIGSKFNKPVLQHDIFEFYRARGEKGITIGDYTRIKEKALLDSERPETGYIKIANNVYVGTGTAMFGQIGLEIGEYSLLAQNITITPYSHISDNPNDLIVKQGGHCEKVIIGRDCYIGMNTAIMYSGSIGDGSVVGAGAVVNKPIPPYSIAVGVPARVIKKRGK